MRAGHVRSGFEKEKPPDVFSSGALKSKGDQIKRRTNFENEYFWTAVLSLYVLLSHNGDHGPLYGVSVKNGQDPYCSSGTKSAYLF